QPGEIGDRGLQPAGMVALPEARCDRLVDDASRIGIRDRAFEPVADLDAHASIVFRDDDQYAVVDRLAVDRAAADLPRLGDADAVLLDRFRSGRRHDENGDLRTLALLQRSELGLERLLLLRRERSG